MRRLYDLRVVLNILSKCMVFSHFYWLSLSVILMRPVKTLSISSANNHLSLELLQQLYSEESNVFFSPFSISTTFGMLHLGARNKTADQLREVLG